MRFTFSEDPTPSPDGLVILCPPGGYDEPLLGHLARYDDALGGHLARLMRDRSFGGKAGQRLSLHTLGRLPFGQLLLLGTGQAESATRWVAVAEQVGDFAARERWKTLAVMPLAASEARAHLEPLARGIALGGYRFDRHRAPDEDLPAPVDLEEICFIGLGERPKEARSLALVEPLARAVAMARDLVNEPAAVMTPTALAEVAKGLGGEGLAVEILDQAACEDLGMGLFLAVARGSSEPPRLIHMTYTPADPDPSLPPVALVGKGITFDSGGLSLKASASMKDMKSDMAGGAAVISAMSMVGAAGVRCQVHGVVPACENMPGGRAYRVGDVIRGMAGPSVEVVNTDAEGRLVLADGISYARSLGCKRIVDLATLTGACLVALGPDMAALLGNPQTLCDELLAAAGNAGEALWQLPLSDDLADQLKSPVADCRNAGGRYGGVITAALFLKKFARDSDWVHLDIAGPAWQDKARPGRPVGGTGFGVATVLRWLSGLEGQK